MNVMSFAQLSALNAHYYFEFDTFLTAVRDAVGDIVAPFLYKIILGVSRVFREVKHNVKV